MKQEELTHAEVVNKWMFYCWNFDSRVFIFTNSFERSFKVYAPSCFEVFDNNINLRDHIINKWKGLSNGVGGSIGLINLYFELSPQYREDMVNYIMINYKGK